ncbi:hypothetical protein [Fodinicola acaciae]|uniref:hypothetical protein n=1 Tax=Fodinicola acaciae TaxID=2681555 RepID=UPI0013D0F955|nr:hypothetical protein [Fodinicola acaciae]
MTTMALQKQWDRSATVDRVAYAIGVALIASGLVHLAYLLATGGSWDGPLSFRKPTTFGLSFGLTLITVAWVATYIRMGPRVRTLLIGAFSLACVTEVALVTTQAWRGVPSHYNLETPFDGVVARTLAFGGGLIVVVIASLTVLAFRMAAQTAPSMRLAVRTGLLTLNAALLIGAAMIAKGLILVFQGQQQAAYATGGWLKPEHAVTMHAVLVLPAVAWLLTFTKLPERRRVQIVWLGIGCYAVAAAVFVLILQ